MTAFILGVGTGALIIRLLQAFEARIEREVRLSCAYRYLTTYPRGGRS